METCVEINLPENSDMIKQKSDAYIILSDMTSFPNYMPNVLGVDEKKITETTSIVNWQCKIDNAPFSWTQENTYDRSNFAINFCLVEGDFDALNGTWKVEDDDKKLILKLQLDYSIGMPVIEDILGPILREKLKSNSLEMLNFIKDRLVNNNAI